MKNKIVLGLFIAAVSSTATAGVKDKKAIRAAEANIKTAITKTIAACGNDDLEVNVEWDDYKDMIKSNKDAIAKKRYKSEWVLSHAGDRTVSTLGALAKICASDADYKEEIANLSEIIVKPKAKFSDTSSEFSIDDDVLITSSGHYTTRKAGDFVKQIKAVY
ncbi:MAG: hypothetical protein HRT95_16105 [Moritella sp.]|uniref:hypothetical protein n=1 Tax=Moritella sp. TaxID=78556 RepID=UPI001D4AD55E|nr:hypothetical protein [Moritella sp.]NQZ51632.1 hypothetical protein [Moritella sp.]